MDEVLLCTKEAISHAPDACSYVQMACANQYKFINFFDFYYCTINQNIPGIVFLSILLVLVLFNLLGTTADRYLAPSLEVLTEKMRMSETIAGVTLVALANGACDVISAVVAGGKESGGVQIATGAVFGGCLFTITCVLARCIQATGFIQTEASSVKRDLTFLMVGVLYFVFLTIIDMITPALACGFFVIYIAYFCFVIYQEKKKKSPVHTVKEQFLNIKHDYFHMGNRVHSEGALDSLLVSHKMKSSMRQKLTRGKSMGHVGITSPQSSHIIGHFGSPSPNKTDRTHIIGHFASPSPDKSRQMSDDVECLNLKDISELSIEEEASPSLWRKVMRVYNKPFLFIRDLTMPPFEESKWNIAKTMFTPYLGILFLIWQFDLLHAMISRWYLVLIYLVVATAISAWIVIRGWSRNLVTHHAGKFAFFTFLVSVMWLTFIAHCFMDFLSLLTVASGLPLEYLSLTILAWGNSLDDFFIDYVICKAGHGKMAITGLFAGQLFNMLVGVGGSMLRSSLIKTVHPGIYNFHGENLIPSLLMVVLIFSLLICLLSILVIAKLNHWNFSKRMMVFVLGYYGIFMVAVTVMSLI